MKTKENIVVKGYTGGGRLPYPDFTIPKGTRVTHRTACGIDKNYHFVDDLSWLGPDDYGLRHDLTYYGYNVPAELVEK